MSNAAVPTIRTPFFLLLLVLEQLIGSRLFGIFFGATKRSYIRRWEDRLSGRPAPQPGLVDRVENLSPEDFHSKYFVTSKPVIFPGAARNWPCCQKWDLDYFAVTLGDQDTLIVSAQGLTTREARSDYQFQTVRCLVQSIRKGEDRYLRFSPLIHDNPHLANDLDLNWLGAMRGSQTFGNTYYMFMGGKGQRTLLHSDQPCNLYVQVFGEKKWTLFYPDDSICLYPEVTNTAYVKSPLDVDNPDHKSYPLFRHARPFIAHLKPGDVMYVPPHVWHHVENLTDTIAVGYRFSSLKAALRSSIAFSLIRVLSTNPPVWKTRKYGKVDTNLIWAHANQKIDQVLADKEARAQARAAGDEKSIH